MSEPPFIMSKYSSELDLHKAAHKYYKALAKKITFQLEKSHVETTTLERRITRALEMIMKLEVELDRIGEYVRQIEHDFEISCE